MHGLFVGICLWMAMGGSAQARAAKNMGESFLGLAIALSALIVLIKFVGI